MSSLAKGASSRTALERLVRVVFGILVIAAPVLLLGWLLKANFSTLPQQVVGGILLGAIYALIALGYTMVYGVLRLINFAHGEVFMLGAYTSLLVSWSMGFKGIVDKEGSIWNLLALLVASMVACGLIGVLIERLAYRPMRTQPRIASLITAIGVSLLLQYGGALVLPVSPPPNVSESIVPREFRGTWNVDLKKPDPAIVQQLAEAKAAAESANREWNAARSAKQPDDVVIPLRDKKNDAERAVTTLSGQMDSTRIGLKLPYGQLVMFFTTVGLMLGLTYLVMFTSVGRAMRAVSHDFDSASLMGINVGKIVTVTFLIGSMLAGAGAMMNATFLGTPLTTQFGVLPGVKAFVAAVLGGIGNIPGAVLGGLLMGVAENLVVWLNFGQYKDAIAFVVLIVVLLLRPGGLLGSAKVEKV